MADILVVYASKYGYTKKYAEWIAAALGADITELSQIKKVSLAGYSKIIFGGGVYASKINGFSFIKNNINDFKNKRLFVYAVGSAQAGEKAAEAVRNANFTPETYGVPLYYFRGGYDHNRLKGLDKFIMGILIRALSKNREKNRDMLDFLENNRDASSEEYIFPIVNAVNRE